MAQPKVFVSSTCYDLSQVRADLNDFISQIGYLPVLSEYSSFPIDPDNDTLENCLQNVQSCDIFILILGGRYGYITDSGKSITNTEYLYAKQNGIPVYVFIYKPLINILPVWKDNKNGNFNNVVDSVKVFEFLEEIREKNLKWCFEFEKAQDIVHTLRIQLSHLTKSNLDLRKKYRMLDTPNFYKHLSAKALDIILKKEQLWEPLFFAQVLKDELEKFEDLKLDLEYRITTSCNSAILNPEALSNWIQINFEIILNLIASLTNLVNNALQKYWGEPNQPSDLKGLYYVASSIARMYGEIAKWSIMVKSTKVHEDYKNLKEVLSDFPAVTLNQIWEYPDFASQEIKQGIQKYNSDPTQKVEIKATLVISANDESVEKFNEELNKIESAIYRNRA
ncbi:DUF4062 domain-containing protein [Taibaiella lutea]|uniref:DUF4062 domain-containing protein n=1 Tax=Taibaiella lutea TaxID=2608001 RepID=A0A5M6CMJ2_9BACT|nr:DUF4062 domain-containing protein [Taibaiella lutea]KAA5536226.1 DUF4062 domain-containing protein [Taibaiella lutea]